MTRVVITGMGLYSPLGCSQDECRSSLKARINKVKVIDELGEYGMFSRLGAPVTGALPDYPRKKIRTMGRVGILAAAATEQAIADAGLTGAECLSDGTAGVAYGSSGGSFKSMCDCADFITGKNVTALNASTYVQMMPHTVAVNLAIFFGIHGRIIATSTACTSGSQAVGYAFECIKSGAHKVMIAGGAEELSPFTVGVFDAMYSASRLNDTPSATPKPFDKKRDGIVVGEGAGTLILEDYDHAVSRGARIYAEVAGFATNCDATHITNPSSEYMEICMRQALNNAGINASAVGYINAHGTGTVAGDIAESKATFRVMGPKIPIATLKSYMGHTLGAAGAIEAILTIMMQRDGWFAPNLNLSEPDDACAALNYITGNGISLHTDYVMSNNFAFGGVNTSLIFKVDGPSE